MHVQRHRATTSVRLKTHLISKDDASEQARARVIGFFDGNEFSICAPWIVDFLGLKIASNVSERNK